MEKTVKERKSRKGSIIRAALITGSMGGVLIILLSLVSSLALSGTEAPEQHYEWVSWCICILGAITSGILDGIVQRGGPRYTSLISGGVMALIMCICSALASDAAMEAPIKPAIALLTVFLGRVILDRYVDTRRIDRGRRGNISAKKKKFKR